jgi:hypothetical protein
MGRIGKDRWYQRLVYLAERLNRESGEDRTLPRLPITAVWLIARPENDSVHVKDDRKGRHETFNSRLKAFKILSTQFKAVCVILQFDVENGHPLFAV